MKRIASQPGCAGFTAGGQPAIRSRIIRFRFCALALPAAFFAALTAGSAQTSDSSVTFTKLLKGSSPEYFAVHVGADGRATYDSHRLDDPGSLRRFQVSPATREKIFSLTHSLNDFHDSELESRHKVANMGMKTLTYQEGVKTSSVEFNYSENHYAQQLCDIFEKISNVEERIAQLQSAMKYDRLNLPQILLQTQVDMDNGLYVEPALMIPTLDQIAADSRYMHLAQSRAHELEARIRKR
jgi:hypothetical protein